MRSLLRDRSSSSSSSSASSSSSSLSYSRRWGSVTGGGCGAATDVVLHVYDLTPANACAYWLGLGAFHSGIEVHGVEYGYGAHERPTSGVFEAEPKSCPGFAYRCSVRLGTTDMSPPEFLSFLDQLSGNYPGDSYHLVEKNCNHFTNDVSLRLTGRPIPGWVNRLAKLGSFCNCFVPERMPATVVDQQLRENSSLSDESEDSVASTARGTWETRDHQSLAKPSGDFVLRRVNSVKKSY